MEQKYSVIPKGSIFTVSSGEHSDYSVLTACVATEEIIVDRLVDEYLEDYPDKRVHGDRFRDNDINKYEFLSWLINTKKYANEIDFFEVHLGDYGEVVPTLRNGKLEERD